MVWYTENALLDALTRPRKRKIDQRNENDELFQKCVIHAITSSELNKILGNSEILLKKQTQLQMVVVE